MKQMEFFESEGDRLKREGMQLAAEHRSDSLQMAQECALMIWQRYHHEVTIEDVRDWFEKIKRKWDLGNAAGSVFKYGWIPVGWRKARHANAHSRMVRAWIRR